GIGILERNDLGAGVLVLVLGLGLFGLDLLGLLVILEDLGATHPRRGGSGLLEIGPGIGLAGIGRDNGIGVEVVELLAGLGIGTLGTAVRTGQSLLHHVSGGTGSRPSHVGQCGS